MKKINRMAILAGLLCAAAIILEAPRARAQEPWVSWTRNPLTIPVRVGVSNVFAETNTTVTVKLADGVATIDGYNCNEPTNREPFTANLKVRREYLLTVVASNLTSLEMQLEFKPNWTVLGRRGKAAKPKDYLLLVDRQLNFGSIYVYNLGGLCTEYSNTWTIELTERLPANWRLEDGSGNAEAAPGDGEFPKLGPGKSQKIDRTAIAWSVGLGRLMDGSAAGRLSVREANLSPEIYTPTNIYYTASSEIVRDEVQLITITTNCPVLRQVKSCQTFVDIVALANSTEMRFYLPSQIGTATNTLGHYTDITGSPFVIWELANPEPAATNKLNITERRNGLSLTNEIIFDPTSTAATWALKYGTGSEQRVETRGVVIATTAETTNRIETVDIRYAGAATPAYRAAETYTLFPWGFELTEVAIDPDNNPITANSLITSITFNTNSDAAHSYRQPDTFLYPDGFWEKRLYEDNPPGPFSMPFSMLKYILRPDRDGPTSPDDADFSNSIVTHNNTWNNSSDVDHVSTYYKPGAAPNSSSPGWFREDWVFRRNESWLDYSFTGAWIAEDGTYEVGDSALSFDDTWGFGYFGHQAYSFDDATTKKSTYVNGGTYDAGTKTFAISTNDVWEGPDFRESVIHYGYTEDRAAGELPVEATLDFVDGQQLVGPGGLFPPYAYVYPYLCWRESAIYHGGSVVQRERHIFTGMDGTNAQFDLVEKWVYQNDSLGHATNVLWIDGATGNSRTIYSADYRGTNTFDGSLPLWQMDETGNRTFFTYDSQKRSTKQVKEGVGATGGFSSQSSITNTASYDAYQRTLVTTTTAGTLSLTASKTYDLAGRVISQTDTNGLTTGVAYDLGGRKTTTTLPTGSTEITENYRDRRLKSVTGTGVVSEYHDWEYTNDRVSPLMGRVVTLHTIRLGSPTSNRIRTEGIDWIGRVVRWETPDSNQTNSIISKDHYGGGRGKLLSSRSEMLPGGATTLQAVSYGYDGTTNTIYTPLGGGSLPAGYNRLARSDKAFAKIGGHWFECTTNTIYRIKNDATATITSITLNRQNGFANGSILSEVTEYDADTNVTVTTTFVDRAAKKITTVVDSAQSTLNATNIVINGLLQLESTPTVSSPTRHYYDALGRRTSLVSPLGYTAYTAYNQYGQVTSVTDFTGQTTAYEYYANGQTGAGQVKCVTTGGKKTYSSYTARDELTRTWGDVPYPEERIYSDYGELVELRTFRGGSGWNGSSWPASPGAFDKTTWTYQDWSGLLLGKTDANNQTVSYTYQRKLLKTRTWARGNTVTNLYNNLGELTGMDYSDGTPSVSFLNSEFPDFSRTGKPLTVSDASGAWQLQYDHADRLVSAACTSDLLNGLTVSNHFNGLYGRDQIQVLGASPLLTNDYRYDAASGRLSVVSNGIHSATYGYLPNSDLLQTTTFKNNGTTKLTTARSWDFGSRLREILNQAGTAMVSAHAYQYDALNRRTRATLEDGSYWQYDYNDRNELTGARRYWPDMYPASGQQFAYGYDNIGNRASASSGGDINGANLRATTYTANGLNQYTAITTPGFEDIMGVALATNSVTVNSGAADRKVEYFHREITVANSGSPVWQDVAVSSGGASSNGGFVFPKNSQAMAYDLDGNLTFDGVWTYEWDGENRLKTMTMTNVSGIPNAQRKRLEFTYDYMNRRVQKVVSSWSGSAFTSPVTNQFVYDGWNLLAILNSPSSILQSFLWGQDLSGTMNNAGGIGGLLAVFDPSTLNNQPSTHFVGYDGNGNITALVNAADQSTSARYEYSPYGELLRSTGPLASLNPFRWSTKFGDEESGLVYYGYRYFSPTQGRWLGRDPSSDQLLELYCFSHNAPTLGIDPDGRSPLFIASIISGAAGAIIGALTAKDGERWLGAGKGALVGLLAPFVGYGAALGGGPIAGGLAAGAFGALGSSALDNYQNGKRFYDLSPKQFGSLGVSMLVGALTGGMLAKLESQGHIVDAGEMILDGMLAFASAFGVGVADAFGGAAESGLEAGRRIFSQ